MDQRHILVVDDEPAMLAMIGEIVSARGQRCECVGSAFEAFERFARALESPPAYDLLITDLVMAGQSGAELVNRVVDLDPYLPIIVMSGTHDLDSLRSAIHNGSWEFIRKPFENRLLVEAMNRAFEKSRIMHEEMQARRVINSLIDLERQRYWERVSHGERNTTDED